SESSLTYANRPALGSTVGSFVAERTKKRTAADVSTYVASAAKNKKTDLTVGLTQESARPALLTTVSSKESGAGAYLDVTLTPPPLKVRSAVASATTSGSAAATFDGDASTAWRVDQNPGWVRWQLASPTHVASTQLSWKANSAKKTVFEVETSNDTGTWTRRYAGQYVGASGKQTVSLSSGVSVKYVRLVVHGNGGSVKTSMLNDVKLLGYDATAAAPSVPSTVLKSVSLDGLGSTLALGSTTQARATVRDTVGNPFSKASVTYSSSNTGVAKVSSSGAVTAAATGSATITVKATAGGVTATDSVAVKVTDTTRVRLYAQADTYVQSSTPGTNFGGEHGMLVKPNAKANRVAYLRFDLTPLAGRTVSSAKLTTESVIVDGNTTPSSVRVHAHSASGSWSEDSLTYAGRPTLGATLGSFVATRTKATKLPRVAPSVGRPA
ncbi:MAG: DNRLRE domain-containing protein, partial [Propionibacteriaceae bacterium]